MNAHQENTTQGRQVAKKIGLLMKPGEETMKIDLFQFADPLRLCCLCVECFCLRLFAFICG
jgi:hypothetical protein